MVKHHQLSKAIDNFAAKLAPKFKGPLVVKSFDSPNIVRLADVQSGETKGTANLQDLKIYHS